MLKVEGAILEKTTNNPDIFGLVRLHRHDQPRPAFHDICQCLASGVALNIDEGVPLG